MTYAPMLGMVLAYEISLEGEKGDLSIVLKHEIKMNSLLSQGCLAHFWCASMNLFMKYFLLILVYIPLYIRKFAIKFLINYDCQKCNSPKLKIHVFPVAHVPGKSFIDTMWLTRRENRMQNFFWQLEKWDSVAFRNWGCSKEVIP